MYDDIHMKKKSIYPLPVTVKKMYTNWNDFIQRKGNEGWSTWYQIYA